METIQCPLPEVHEALSPYIHTRQETARIRAVINQNLTTTQDGLSVLDLHDTSITLNDDTLTGCSGVRKAYSRALEAHRQAQAKLERLRKDIETLQQSTATVQQPAQHQDEAFKESMAAIRARRQAEKLTIVENAFHQLLVQSESKPGLKEVMEEHATKSPHAPSASHTTTNGSTIDESIHLLKRAVIQAERTVGLRSKNETPIAGRPSLAAQAYALSRTRDFLIAFVEEQLSKIPEDAFGSKDGDLQPNHAEADAERHETNRQEILAFYDQYIDARKTLVSALSKSEDEEVIKVPVADLAAKNPISVQPPRVAAISMQTLPYIRHLLQKTDRQETLLQQSTYLRKQTKTAENAIHLAVSRLADESLIVEPGVDKTRAWADAAAEGRTKDTELVTSRLKTGNEALEKANAIIARLRGLT
ncbi:hypothetical protein MBLNU457_7721t1 [Dothideomycetes sp. NU457]